MQTLKKGSKGADVKKLQKLLNDCGFSLTVDGDFGKNTYQALVAFQSENIDKHGDPLTPDGMCGPLTWFALENYNNKKPVEIYDPSVMPGKKLGGTAKGRAALAVAISELNAGAKEIGGNNMGKFVAKYLKPAGLVPPESWCASFVSWCFYETVGEDKKKMPFQYSPGARNLLEIFKAKKWSFSDGSKALPGDIIVWWRESQASWKGHIGFVHHVADGFVYTIEGNKSSKVEGFKYPLSRIEQLLGFGRVPD